MPDLPGRETAVEVGYRHGRWRVIDGLPYGSPVWGKTWLGVVWPWSRVVIGNGWSWLGLPDVTVKR